MTTTIHKNLTGADLHEPKGADTALAGRVYVSNGSGSGVWTDAATVITNTAFTTGDLKPTHKTAADSGWILWIDGNIGDGSSGANARANADTAALFALYWNNYTNALCAVSGGRGGSAAADYAAHKTINLPTGAGRALSVAGTGSGLTARVIGTTAGEETHLLTGGEIPAHFHPNTLNDPGHFHSTLIPQTLASFAGGGFAANGGAYALSQNSDVKGTGMSINNLNNTGGGGVHNNIQPTSYVNVMIKL